MKFILEKRTKLFYCISTLLLITVLVIFYANSPKEIASSKFREAKISISNEGFRLPKAQEIDNENGYYSSELPFFLLLIFIVAIFTLGYLIIKSQREKNKELEALSYSAKLASHYSLSLIEASRDPLFTISPEGKITDTNQASVSVTDVSKVNLIGSDFITYFTEPEKAKKGYEEVFSKGFVVDYPLTIKDGKLTPVLFNGSVYKDENENTIGAVVVARDITDQKRIATELIEARVFAELATEIAEEEKRNAQDATLIAENAVKAK